MTYKVIGSTMGVSTAASIAKGTGYYTYRGKQPYRESPPEALPQNASATAAKRERVAEYTRRRLAGQTKEEAAAAIRIRASTMGYYERNFQDRQRREKRGG